MKKRLRFIICIVSALFLISLASAGTVEHLYQGSNVCRNPTDTLITFENGVDSVPITNQYPGMVFSATTNQWIYADVRLPQYGYPRWWNNGNFFAWAQAFSGRIDFPDGASYVSILIASPDPVTMDAYDASNTQIDTAGPTSDNLDTSKMDRLIVSHSGIKYVLIHTTLSGWVLDDVCTDAGANINPISSPEFPSVFLPAAMIIGFLGVVFYIKRTREH